MKSIKKIALSKSISKSNLFIILENIFPITFVESQGYENFFAKIMTDEDMRIDLGNALGYHTFCVYKRDLEACRNPNINSSVRFSNSSLVPLPFKNRKIELKEKIGLSKEINIREAEPILFWEDHCIWAIRKVGKYFQYFSAIDIIDIPIGKSLFEYFNGSNFIALLPLIDFLRRVTKSENGQNDSFLKSCIIFDDPNLHFRRYGFINYKELAAHSQTHNYHVGIATIPIDLYYAADKSVKIFKDYERWLSLLIHGNDHSAHELGQDLSEDERKKILAKALQRVLRFENRFNLDISRVMIAPHGDCTDLFLREMPRFGIEGAFISYQGLKRANKNKKWTEFLGYDPFTIFDCLAVANRFRFLPDSKNQILLSAYLGHPIIPFGHHWDLKDGLDILKELADFINGIDKISWMKPRDIFRSNYGYDIYDDILIIKPISPRIHIEIPSGIRFMKVVMEKKEKDQTKYNYHLYSNQSGHKIHVLLKEHDIISVSSGTKVTLINHLFSSIDFMKIKTRAPSMKAIIRRLLTEIRDHVLPYTSRIMLL